MTSVEQQLIAALFETPHQTNCSVSSIVLRGLGLKDDKSQVVWLNTHREAREGKCWQRIHDRWEYAEVPALPAPEKTPGSAPASSSWRTQAKAERLIAPIVVKPVLPLGRHRT